MTSADGKKITSGVLGLFFLESIRFFLVLLLMDEFFCVFLISILFHCAL